MKLAQKVEISDEIIAEHVKFNNDNRQLTTICATSFGSIYVVAWQPGQKCYPHLHDNSLGVIHVLEGELTHYQCQKISHMYPYQYRRIKTDQIQSGRWIGVDLNQMHELVNESLENLITLHFRFFKSPVVLENPRHDCPDTKQQVI